MATISDEAILGGGTVLCHACQEYIPAAAKFCPECGAKPSSAPSSSSSSSQDVVCTKCGVEIPASAKFCPECGTRPPSSTPKPVQLDSDPSGPPCHACDRLISGRILTAQGRKWHPDCFQCSQCAQPIGGDSYIVRGDKPWCEKCVEWEKKEKRVPRPVSEPPTSSNTGKAVCAECGQIIQGTATSFRNGYYHKPCLKCKGCNQTLDLDKGFLTKGDAPYHTECAKKLDAPAKQLCAGCNGEITSRFVKPGNSPYHPDCFKCSSCKGSLAGGFLEKDGRYLCGGCAQKSAPVSTPAPAPIRFDHKTGTAYKVEPKTTAPTQPKPTPSTTPSIVVTDVPIPASGGRRISTGGSGRNITCTGCFAPMPADAPKCLGCGKSNARVGSVGVRRDSASGAPSGPKTPTASSIPPKTQTSVPVKTSPQKPPPVSGATPTLTPAPPPSGRAFCPDCGASLPPGVKFCGECGMKF